MAQPDSARFAAKARFVPAGEEPMPEDTYENRFEALQRTDERHEARLNGIDARYDAMEARAKDRIDYTDAMFSEHEKDFVSLEDRTAFLEAHMPDGEYHFGRDLLQRLSSRKFQGMVFGVASAVALLALGYIDGDAAAKMIFGVIGTFTAFEGGADIVGRFKAGQ